MKKTVIVLNKTQMGNGDRELGEKILGACVRKLVKFDGLEAIVFYNSGVKLCTRDSHLAPEFGQLMDRGIEILACGTCVEYYGLGDRMIVDRLSNMDEILATIAAAEKVVTL